MRTIQQGWTTFKTTVADKELDMQYVVTDTNYYDIWGEESSVEYQCRIKIETPAGTDQSDFETNYKSNANKRTVPNKIEGSLVILNPVFYAHLRIPTITATTSAIVIDKNNTSYQHDSTKNININFFRFHAIKSDPNDVWQINFGIVRESNTTDGTVIWFHHTFDYTGNSELNIIEQYKGTFPTDINGGSVTKLTSEHKETATTWKSNGTLRTAVTNPMMGTPTAGAEAGDLVIQYKLISGSGNLNKNTATVAYTQH